MITPAHLLLVPSDSADTINFLNFKNIGINSLNESSAFAKIRNFTKVYNTHLVHTPSSFVSKYNKLNSLYGSEDAVLGASPFSITKQQNLLSISSIGNDLSGTLLDSGSLTQFLSSAIGIGQGARAQSATAEVTPSSLPKLSLTRPPLDFTRFAPLLAGSSTQLTANQARLGAYPALLGHVNSDSDKPALHHPALHTAFTGLLNGVWTGSELQFSQGGLESATSHVSAHAGQTYTNATVAPRTLNINGTNARILAGDQSLRSLPPMAPSSSSLNVSLGENVTVSNLSLAERVNRATTPFSNATAHAAGYADYPLVSKLAGARSFSATPHPASQSAHAANSGSLEYDTGRLGTQTAAYLKTGFLAYSTQVGKSPVGDVFVGSREKTPKSINAAY